MNESQRSRKILDESHPDCPIYTEKFHAIWDEYFQVEKAERAKYPDWHGHDHPANETLCPLFRECCVKTKALQQEYAHIFTVDYTPPEE